jgi:hypothetical protein
VSIDQLGLTEQTTFNQYYDSHPSVCNTAVATLRGIIRAVPLPNPTVAPHIDDHHEQDALSPPRIPEQILRRELDGTRAGLRESHVPPEDLLIDEVESDDRLGYGSCAQHESPAQRPSPGQLLP